MFLNIAQNWTSVLQYDADIIDSLYTIYNH